MSGALKSVFGGKGILGALFSVASICFPPLSIATSLSNLLTLSIGQAVRMAATTLIQEFGMPKFLEKVIDQVASQTVSQLSKPSDDDVDAYVENHPDVQNFMHDMTQDLTNQIIENTRRHVAEAQDAKEKSTGRRSPVGAGGWLEAIAMAMGEVMGQKAAKMVELSHQMSHLSATQEDQITAWENLDTKLSDKKFSQQQKEIEARDKANAMEFSKVQAQFQAAGQEFSMLSSSFTNAIKSIGEGLSQMARKG